jgi:hypothetical protein
LGVPHKTCGDSLAEVPASAVAALSDAEQQL